MPKGKQFPLSIVLRTFDRATAGIRRVNARLRALAEPVRRISNRMRALAGAAGFPQLARGFRRVGSAARSVATAVGGIAVAAGLGVAGLKRLIAGGDGLAKAADRIGVTVDALAQLRFAASQSGVEVGAFDVAMDQLSKRVGEAKAGTGALTTLLQKMSPALLKQVKGATDAEEAMGILADAMVKIEDPTKRTALATAAFGRAGAPLVNMLRLGAKGINDLKGEYADLAGPQEKAARDSAEMTDAMGRVSAVVDGVKAGILTGLAPAFLELADKLKKFLVQNREAIAAWARDFGEKLPGRIKKLVNSLNGMIKAIRPVWNAIGGLRTVAIALAAVLGGKLVFAVAALGKALLATPIGLFITGVARLIVAGKELHDNWHLVRTFFQDLWADLRAQFGGFFDWAKNAFLNFTPLGLIIKHWEPLTDFFKTLWDGITAIFEAPGR